MRRVSAPGETRIERVGEDQAGQRLDAYLAACFPLSRSRAERLIAEEQVLVNGLLPRKRDIVQAGDEISLTIPPAIAPSLQPEPIPVDILYQDADLAVVDKPPGLVVHPAPGHPDGTLVNALLHHLGDLAGIGGVLRPGIVHRLDRDTSGLMVVAKTDLAHQRLSAALKARQVRRSYLVACWGHLAEDEIVVDQPVGRHRGDRKRMAVVPQGGRRALTRFRRLERWPAAELLRADLGTGRTHQIRVHLLHIGHPVVGDQTYAPGRERGVSGRQRAWAAQLARRVPRQFLHAYRLRFQHPRSGEALTFRSPLPPDLSGPATWARLGG